MQQYSHGALEQVTLYSIMEDPMTSCGCFECICGIEPCSNGVVIANREHAGMTPLGMTFSELASMTGGGVQTPGFMGHGKHFIASKKFLKAEGGSGPYRMAAEGAEGTDHATSSTSPRTSCMASRTSPT